MLMLRQLHHAICAISALNLSYRGQASLEEAMQHYHQALSAQATATHADDLISDGVFFRHFLLFIYDICIPLHSDNGGADMWAEHLNHLRRIATQRHARYGHDPHAYLLWSICTLDMYACLMGSGDCGFIRTLLRHNMLPPLERQIPSSGSVARGPYLPNEVQIFPDILELNQGIVIHTAKLAQTAQTFRKEAASRSAVSPGTYARFQASVSQLQNELLSFWNDYYPEFLGPESAQAGVNLPPRVRAIFEHVCLAFGRKHVVAC